MFCPNCEQQFETLELDKQVVLHCPNCGSSFFEENSINRLSLGSAKKLAKMKKNIVVMGIEKHCPKDSSVLTPIVNSEAIPTDATLLTCPTCRGVFAYPDDLVVFKDAQDVKISFFKLWHTPLPSIRAILVLSFFAVVSLGAFGYMLRYTSRNSTSTRASEQISQVRFVASGRYLFLTFKTTVPVESQVRFTDTATGQKITLPVSQQPVSLHHLTTTELNLHSKYTYVVIISDKEGHHTQTNELEVTY
ncbi:zf-TFIIB domain-containing protein [Candidatus Roizmanbacteria bacterium]|nr:zf-TFIIB domain-containing protein [Candidatus Roizmanbacteria bacterium]